MNILIGIIIGIVSFGIGFVVGVIAFLEMITNKNNRIIISKDDLLT
jgi:hypothetical protein